MLFAYLLSLALERPLNARRRGGGVANLQEYTEKTPLYFGKTRFILLKILIKSAIFALCLTRSKRPEKRPQ
jgi:hypothetical protein